jgi:glycosyltransferase involved in cell wall biosynthesis
MFFPPDRMKIALLSGAFPPQFDGIGDHNWWLSQALAEQGHLVTVLTSFPQDRPQPVNVQVLPCFEAAKPQTIKAILPLLQKGDGFDWLIVQYNPFSFGSRGFAPGLLSALRSVQIPIACIFHETFAIPLWPWQHILMRLWQYPQFVSLVRIGRCHFVASERWLAQVRQWAKGPSILLPVGSNLPLCPITKQEARKQLGLRPDALILGVFGFGHISKRTEWIGAAARQIYSRFPQTEVLCVSQVGDRVRNNCGDVPVRIDGYLPGPEASLRLRAMDLFLAPVSDGISARRGSVVAALQHGIPICSTVRAHTDRFLREFSSPAFSLTPGDNLKLFAENAVRMAELSWQLPELGHDLVKFHDRHFAWPVLAERLVSELLKVQSSPPAVIHPS